jgi:hypothetical protein
MDRQVVWPTDQAAGIGEQPGPTLRFEGKALGRCERVRE